MSHCRVRVVGYTRVSLEEMARNGVSLEAQKSKIVSYCELNDLELVEVVEDAGISGKNLTSRPGIQAVIKMLEDGIITGLVIYKLDRMSRSTRDVIELTERIEKRGWQLHSISERLDTSSAAGRFVLTILAALAQMERETISERTRLALGFKKSRGDRLGTTAMGYVTVVDAESGRTELRPLEAEQRCLHRIHALRTQGMTYVSIAQALNDEQVPTKRGKHWYPATVRYLVQKVIPRALV